MPVSLDTVLAVSEANAQTGAKPPLTPDQLSSYIAVNADGARFYDEGEDLWPKRYAVWGSLIAAQPGQAAFAIFDSSVIGGFIPSVFRPVPAASIEELARALGLDPSALLRTVSTFNDAVQPGGTFRPGELDDCRTAGIAPPKSHWACRLEHPPYYGYPLRPGVTFTYLGVEVDAQARVMDRDGRAFDNVFAAGECMAGNILSRGYLAGFGLTIGTVFGRIAGASAAAHVCA